MYILYRYLGIYPLVIQQLTVEKHIFLWVNHRTKKSIFHTELLNYRRVRRPPNSICICRLERRSTSWAFFSMMEE